MTISSTKTGDTLKIYINDILHLCITDRITGIQSYKEEVSWYKIEIQTKNNNTLLEYDSFEKWNLILTELNKWL